MPPSRQQYTVRLTCRRCDRVKFHEDVHEVHVTKEYGCAHCRESVQVYTPLHGYVVSTTYHMNTKTHSPVTVEIEPAGHGRIQT